MSVRLALPPGGAKEINNAPERSATIRDDRGRCKSFRVDARQRMMHPGGLVRAGGVEPPQALLPYGFSYQLRLSPPPLASRLARLWSGLYLHPAPAEVRCCPSSLYTFPPRACLLGKAGADGLGSGLPVEVSPNLGSSASEVSPGAPKSRQVRCVYRFRHARVTTALYSCAGGPPASGFALRTCGARSIDFD